MQGLQLSSVRPLVRYVDENVAVIDVHIALIPPLPTASSSPLPLGGGWEGGSGRSGNSGGHTTFNSVEVFVEIAGADGSMDEQRAQMPLRDHAGVVRFQVVTPERWWPAGMGTQALYRIKVSVLSEQVVADSREITLGLTSVRPGNPEPAAKLNQVEWLVNGQVCRIQTVVPVDLVHERRFLPVAGHSLLVIRGHYGPEVLYDAADRAGLLMLQCVPIDGDAQPEAGVINEIDRLSSHPSLAGWLVGHLGQAADNVARTIHRLDPTHQVFRHVPGN